MNTERLAQPLDRARVKTRPAGGSKPALSYLETHDVIRTANEIFGFGGWGHEIVDLRLIPGVSVSKDGKAGYHVGYVCIVRLTVQGSVATSGVGFGDAVEYRDAAPVTAHELAAKEAESDALKRALKNYGDQFGLALYDKQAATSGHLASAVKPPQISEQEKTRDDTADLASALFRLADEYKQLVPDFDATIVRTRAAEKAGESDYRSWLLRQTASFENNIAAKKSEKASAEKFPIPAGASKAAAPAGDESPASGRATGSGGAA